MNCIFSYWQILYKYLKFYIYSFTKNFTGGEVDAARGRFDAALQGLLQKDEESDSENESDNESKSKVL